MVLYTVRLQDVPVAVLRGDTLADETDLARNWHPNDALECHPGESGENFMRR